MHTKSVSYSILHCAMQEVLDEAFHAAEDAYPAGSPEHRELLVRQCLHVRGDTFVPQAKF